MKKTLFTILGLALLAAGCTKDNSVTTEAPRHLKINITANHGGPDTRAVKNEWEAGDEIYIFFDFGTTTTDNSHLTMTWDGSKWNNVFSDPALETYLLGRTEGTLVAIYYHNGSPESFVLRQEGSTTYMDANFDLDTQRYHRMGCLACLGQGYTVSEGVLTATLEMTMESGRDYVQFFIPGITNDDNYIFTCNQLMAVYPSGFYRAPGSYYATLTANNAYGGDIKGYYYSGGIVFTGLLHYQAKNTAADYNFTVTDTKGTDDTSDDMKYALTVTGKTLTTHDAVKLPALDSGKWGLVVEATIDI